MASSQGNWRAGNDHNGKPHMKSKPVLRDLLQDLESFVNWQLLIEKLESIEGNFQHNIDRQKLEAFDKWLRRKPDACWKDVIDVLYEMEEITLASRLAKKYAWEDPRVFVNWGSLSASNVARITATRIGDIPHRRFLPQLAPGLEYYTLEDESVQPMNERSAAVRTEQLSRRLQTDPRPYSLADFFKSIENSNSKGNFKVGLEARFGHLYWKLEPTCVLPANSTSQEWIRSKLLKKRAFTSEVEEADVEQLFVEREQLGKEVTKISVTFVVDGQDDEIYSAAISANEKGNEFRLDAVYRKQPLEKRARLSIALPGRKYDLRISDCSECMLTEHQNSNPYQMALTISKALCRLPDKRLRVILRGSSPNNESSWKVKYIRQRVQRQYKWKPEKRWILARYDVDVLDYEKNQAVVDIAPLNKGVDILEFDYSRKEVEFWGQNIYPSNVSDTHPSRDKYYYMEGIEGVGLPGGELREPYNWTTEELLRDFEEFLGDAFKIAHILNGSPY
ncbi:uncharacterized protein LOC135335996 isoform X2 [Halichondria panicea]|uniref:uncharacterized protein LOC135335996 isoform X2 n=1 Tax=Halichondria panicea TaxID=6063 RepID=UPI00312B7094